MQSDLSIANGEVPLAQDQITTDFSEIIAENFGANATYVETLLARWQSNPALVDESWRTYFEELVGSNGDGTSAGQAKTATAPQTDGHGTAAKPAKSKKSEPPAIAAGPQAKSEPAVRAEGQQPEVERLPIRGAALKIVENMEASLAVP